MTNPAPPTSGVQLLEVAPEYAGQRIDNFLRTQLKGVPKTLIYRIPDSYTHHRPHET